MRASTKELVSTLTPYENDEQLKTNFFWQISSLKEPGTYAERDATPARLLVMWQHLPSAVLTVPPLLFNLVAFQTLSISAGAIEAARPPGKPESFLKLTNDVGVGSPEFDVGGCVVYSTSIFIRKSWAPLCNQTFDIN